MDILQVLTDEEKLKEITQKITEYKELVEAKGGINKINQIKAETQSQAELARAALKKANQDSEKLLEEANEKAEEIIQIATERAERILYLADEKLKQANHKESELKKEYVKTSKQRTKVENNRKALVKAERDLTKRQNEVIRKESILAQLQPGV